jgi:peptidoglycan/xylan/chitin deacetylase (PgdA/CDA1 family)
MGSRLLGWFTQPTVRDVMLRRLLIACRGSPAALAAAGRLIPGEGGRQLWFGFVSRYAFWLGVRRSMDRREWLQTTRGVPVLMYHAFAQGGDRERLVVRRRDFSRQMRLLALLRFRVIGFEELLDLVRSGEPLPRRSAAITIDDGYLDNLEIAAPILRRHRFPVTIFLVSGRLGGSNDWGDRGVVADRPLLSLDQITGLREEGSVRFGAHTRNHARLPEASDETLLAEVSGSREDLERALGDPVEAFAYPYGKFDQRVARAVAEAGYRGACTVESRLACPGEDPMLVPRIEVRGTDSLARFLVKLWFGGA